MINYAIQRYTMLKNTSPAFYTIYNAKIRIMLTITPITLAFAETEPCLLKLELRLKTQAYMGLKLS